MLEVIGNLWTYPANVRVITTNGVVKANGEAVMGAGCALEAKQRFPELAYMLGLTIRGQGNVAFWFPLPSAHEALVTFPTKHDWRKPSDLKLIVESAIKIAGMQALQGRTIVLPRPGCGNGGLKWQDVKPLLEPILDNRFHVISPR